MNKEKTKRIIDFSDSDFLFYLYAERDREDSLNSYQGWSAWAIAGAMITIMCAGYSILCKHDVDFLRMIYILSGIVGFCLCYRPLFLFLGLGFSRERGIDIKKIKYLKDITPKPYIWVALPLSVLFPITILICEDSACWNVVSISWIVAAVILLASSLYGWINKNKIVWPAIEGIFIGDRIVDSLVGGLLGGVLSITWLQSFNKVKGNIIGDPDFEIAVCIFVVIALFFLFLTIKSREKMASCVDVLLDEFLYKGIDKETIYYQLLIQRMGYSVLDACAQELNVMQGSFKIYESQIKSIKDVERSLACGDINFNQMIEYFEVIKSVSKYVDNCSKQSKSLYNKLAQIGKLVPGIKDIDEYEYLMRILDTFLKKEDEIIGVLTTTSKKMNMWINVYHCDKYGGWCESKNCSHRHDRKSWRYIKEIVRIWFARCLGSAIKLRTGCKKGS